MGVTTLTKDFLGRSLTIETGKLAKQATGSVTIQYGDTVILVTSTVAKKPREGMDFFPLLVDYQEKFYATGKMKGSRFIKRETRPPETAILAARMIDRPLRPMFPKNMRNDVQVVITVLSADMVNDPEDIAILGASAACLLTGAGFSDPIAGVRVGLIGGKFVVNPTYEQMEESRLDLMVAGTEKAITMIESGAKEVTTEEMLEALDVAHDHIKQLCAMQRDFVAQVGEIAQMEVIVAGYPEEVETAVKAYVTQDKVDPLFNKGKAEMEQIKSDLHDEVLEHFATQIEDESEGNVWTKKDVSNIVGDQIKYYMRKKVLDEGVRLDGRSLDQIRTITCEAGLIPRTHGSGLFTRGETQVLSLLTLGSPGDSQMLDEMDYDIEKSYMHHYNFPGFSVGEVTPMRSPGRREIGHGDLAERALIPVLPSKEEFPYVMRVVSEVLESNGSSSMGSVCGSTLTLMDGGVPIKRPVSGIAMGLIMDKDTGKYAVLSDIQGAEDFLGDMDFKVAGTENGITALQLDIKIEGLTREILQYALEQGNKGREFILGKMMETLSATRSDLSEYAPRILSVKIKPDQIGAVIGSGGKVIKEIQEKTGVDINIDDDGLVSITSTDAEMGQKALDWVKNIVYEPQMDEEFDAKVTKITDFGAFVEYLPGKEGLVHISELAPVRINNVSDVVKEGDVIHVKIIKIDPVNGKVGLTHKPFSKMNPDNQ